MANIIFRPGPEGLETYVVQGLITYALSRKLDVQYVQDNIPAPRPQLVIGGVIGGTQFDGLEAIAKNLATLVPPVKSMECDDALKALLEQNWQDRTHLNDVKEGVYHHLLGGCERCPTIVRAASLIKTLKNDQNRIIY
jgi:hypothetical protein